MYTMVYAHQGGYAGYVHQGILPPREAMLGMYTTVIHTLGTMLGMYTTVIHPRYTMVV